MQVAFLLRGVKVPNDVIWQTINPVAGDLCQLCKPFRFDLMVYRFNGKIDTWLSSHELVIEEDRDESVGYWGEYLCDELLLVPEG